MIKNKKIIIIGFGKEGVAAANFLGKNNQISIFDDNARSEIDPYFFKCLKIKPVNWYLGNETFNNPSLDYLVRSPGVKLDHPIICKLTRQGVTLTSPTKIFFDLCPCPIIGVTGTKGKGTTATLIYELLKSRLKSIYLAGNIGTPALDILSKLNKNSLVVLELSSFQLIDLKKSPHIAVVLMITSEHLNWHPTSKEYIIAKESVVKYQKSADFAVINKDFEISRNFAKKTKAKVFFVSTKNETNGVYITDNWLMSNITINEKILKTSQILLPGKHNLQNVISAVAIAKIFKVENEIIKKVLKDFKGLPHRLQLIATIRGVSFYNDSYSTIPETTIAAINAFDKPKILILGGSSKNSDFSSLALEIHKNKSIKAIILIGFEAKRLKEAITHAGGFKGRIIEGSKNMAQIINAAKSQAVSGDIVILSPACASFDMYKNYKDRGDQFTGEVKLLKRSNES